MTIVHFRNKLEPSQKHFENFEKKIETIENDLTPKLEQTENTSTYFVLLFECDSHFDGDLSGEMRNPNGESGIRERASHYFISSLFDSLNSTSRVRCVSTADSITGQSDDETSQRSEPYFSVILRRRTHNFNGTLKHTTRSGVLSEIQLPIVEENDWRISWKSSLKNSETDPNGLGLTMLQMEIRWWLSANHAADSIRLIKHTANLCTGCLTPEILAENEQI